MDFSNKLYVYVDAAALQDPQAEHFMEVLAKQYRQIILFVENVWEEETLKQLPAYGYICRTVYGLDLQSVLEKDRARRSPDKTKHILFITRSAQTLHGISVLCLGKMGLEQILLEKLQNEKKRRAVIAGICMGCVAVSYTHLDVYKRQDYITINDQEV